ncbi:MAG: hypothetical protein AABZ29_07385 [Gemmatimonadota bacterium]
MTQSKIGERERPAGEWFGAPREGQVPVRAPLGGKAAGAGAGETSRGSHWLRRLGRVLRDAAIAVAILAMVPIGVVTVSRGYVWRMTFTNTRARLVQGEATRPFAPSRDARTTPMQAGLALAAMNPERENAGAFPLRPVSDRAVRPWNGAELTAGMFPTAQPGSWSGPSSQSILEAAAAGLSAREVAYLQTVATAPLWTQYDLIARAPAVDILGGRFVLPYPDDAMIFQMPIMRFAATKELAYAGVSRAAYHLAVGQRAEAEAALKSIIGFGFAIIDNGTFAIDGLIGRVIVEIGRDGLGRFYTLTGNPRATAVVAAKPPGAGATRFPQFSNTPTAEYLRDQLLRTAGNTAEPRPIRYEALQQLSLSSCTNVRELVFGTGSDVRQAYDRASRDLARFPSERAILDLVLQTTDRARDTYVPAGGVVVRLLVGASTLAGTVLDNPRMPFCTRAIFSQSGFPR